MLLAGAVGGTLGDRYHTWSGVLAYPDPVIFDEAWWVPLPFAAAGLGLCSGHRLLRGLLHEPAVYRRPRDIVLASAMLAAAYAASGLLPHRPLLLAALMAVAFIVRAAIARSRVLVALALGGALVGCVVEGSLAAGGAFAYTVPTSPLGLPVWLPGLYFHAAFLVAGVDDLLRIAWWRAHHPHTAAEAGQRAPDAA